MSEPQRSPRAAAALVLAVTLVLGLVLSALHLPSAVLFASLIGGMAHALTSPTVLRVPLLAFRVGQALIGVTIGSLVSLQALTGMGRALVPIAGVTAGTVLLSLLAGRLLALREDV